MNLEKFEAAIHTQVIERGEFEPGLEYKTDVELDINDEVYIIDFYLTATIGDEGETNEYDIDIIFVSRCTMNGIRMIYSKSSLFETMGEILSPN